MLGRIKKKLKGAARPVVVRVARVYIACGRPPVHEPRVYLVLMSAWGMGGTIRSGLQVAAHLAERREVEVVSVVRRRRQPFFAFPPGVRVRAIDDQRRSRQRGRLHRLLAGRGSVLVLDRSRRAVSLWTDLQLVRTLRTLGPGVLITTRPGLNVLAAELAPQRLATVGQEHMHIAAHGPRVMRAIRNAYGRLDVVVTLTDGDRQAYERELGGDARIEAIPNAVPALGSRVSPLTEHVVLGAGRLTRQKDFGTLVRAFGDVVRAHPDWSLRICGDGPQRDSLEALVRELGLGERVALPGRARDLAAEMERASIFALSSRFEGFPMVVLEALGKGLPVVSFDCPTGPRELIDDGRDGILVPPGDTAGLARAIAALIEDEERRRRCGSAARDKASRYRMEAIGARWDALLDDLLGREATP